MALADFKVNHVPLLSTELRSERLRLTACLGHDADAVFEAEAESLQELRRWFWWCHPAHSRERCTAWASSRADAWRAGEEYSFVITGIETHHVLGSVWLNAIDRLPMRASLGYWVRSSCVGKGIASEASRLVTRWGFDVLELERVEIVLAVGNKPSQRVAEKLGAVCEGIARRRLRVNAESQDAFVYSILPAELT